MARFERHGVLGTETDGVFFTESTIAHASVLGPVTVTSDRQNVSLDEMKRKLVRLVRERGGDTLMQFAYSQKGTVFSFSSTRMTASGVVALLGTGAAPVAPPGAGG